MNEAIRNVVHIGAGEARDLDELLQHQPESIHLLEPNPEYRAHLERLSAKYDNVYFYPWAVSEFGGTRNLNIFNLPYLSSLHQPSGIQRIFPGLKQTQAVPVESYTASELIELLGWADQEDNFLLLEVAGEEFNVLKELAEQGLLRGFSRLDVWIGTSPLYVNAASQDELQEWLEGQGYDLASSGETDEPSQPRLSFRLNRHRLRQEAVEEELEESKGQLRSLASEHEALKELQASLEQAYEQLKREHEE
ncbi:hypothetical protein, partial [Thioalkalivibrio sp. ALJT]|uniref:hypothetical protein n=1 Tax=Thioalkalivibrio sp. ALJT TaxID=1158146 RepID=UPI0012DD013A